MSDTFYREQARKRSQLLWVIIALVLIVVLGILARRALLYDSCTRSTDRLPQSVVSSYFEAIVSGDQANAQDCWQHDAYYDLAAGCSEICLSRAFGHAFEVTALEVSEPQTVEGERERIVADVTVVCAADGQAHAGQVTLDSVASDVPWKHWAIIESSVGGTVAGAWCP